MAAPPAIFFSPRSCSVASIAALEQTGIEYEARQVAMSPAGAGDEAFVRLNPRRQVPVLQAGDVVLRETSAILAYLDREHPDAGLLPADADARLKALEWLGHIGGTLHPAFRPIFRPHRFVGEDPALAAALKARTLPHIDRLFEQVERDLAGRDWLAGPPTGADNYLFVVTRWMRLLGRELGPSLEAHYARTAARPAMTRALACEAGGGAPIL